MRSFTAFLIFLCGLTAWRLWPAFAEPNVALGTMGDAAGTIGWIWEVGRQFDQHGWYVFLNGDVLKTTFFGAGFMDPVPVMNPAWRLLYIGITRLELTPDNAYDAVIAFQYLIAGIVGWFFAASFGLKTFWRYVFVFLMLSIENTSIRIAGHNGLVFVYGPLLALIASLKYAQKPSRIHAFLLSSALWFSFLSNEYLGYFSFWACLTLIISQNWTALKRSFKEYIFQQAHLLWPALVLFLYLMCLSHPSVTILKVVAFWERIVEPMPQELARVPALRETNPASEFLLYGLKNPLAVLDSWLIPIPNELAPKIFGRNTHEFTYRWGVVLPVFVWWVLRMEKKETEKIPFKPMIFSVVIVTFLLGMRTDVGLSLGWLTRLVAPMFRVGVRAHFISLVFMILLFVLCAQWLWDHRKIRWGSARFTAIFFIIFGLTAVELGRSGPLVGQHAVFPISALTPLARALAREPHGLTLLIPALSGHYESESYFLASTHGKPVLNSQFGSNDSRYRTALFTAVETPNEAARNLLKNCGIRYIIEPKYEQLRRSWSSVAGLRLVTESETGRVLELVGAKAWPVELGSALHADIRDALAQGRSALEHCVDTDFLQYSSGAEPP